MSGARAIRTASAVLLTKQPNATQLQYATRCRPLTTATHLLSNVHPLSHPCRPPHPTLPSRQLHLSARYQGVISFKLADIGEGISEVELLEWNVNVGDDILEMDTACKVQSDKSAVEITSRYTGKIVKLHHNVGDIVKIGQNLMDIDVEDAVSPTEEKPKETPTQTSSPHPPPHSTPTRKVTPSTNIQCSPATRRLAKELGVSLEDVAAAFSTQKVTKEAVEEYAKNAAAGSTKSSSSESLGSTVVTLRGFSRTMAKSMTESLKVPHLHVGDQIDITQISEIRNRLKQACKAKHGLNLTLTTVFIKAISAALSKYPILNSKFNTSGDSYTMYDAHNISIAMDTPNGLVVPNIKNVQNLTLVQIQAELGRLQDLASNNRLTAAELTGGTVALSNVGSIGGTLVKALLFDNQGMIIALGRIQKMPRFDARNNIVARDIMHWGYSADHRFCDGATVTRFSAEVRRLLENPDLLQLDVD